MSPPPLPQPSALCPFLHLSSLHLSFVLSAVRQLHIQGKQASSSPGLIPRALTGERRCLPGQLHFHLEGRQEAWLGLQAHLGGGETATWPAWLGSLASVTMVGLREKKSPKKRETLQKKE